MGGALHSVRPPLCLNLCRGVVPRSQHGELVTQEFADSCLANYKAAEEQSQPLARAYFENDEQVIVDNLANDEDIDTFIKGKPVKAREQDFLKGTRRIARPLGSSTFPSEVPYPDRCLVVCRHLYKDAHTIGLYILNMLAKSASWCKQPSKVPGCDMLLVLETTTRTAKWRSFWFMICASYRSGHHRAQQTFWRCESTAGPVLNSDYEGVQFRVKRQTLVDMATSGPAPFNWQSSCPEFYDEDALSELRKSLPPTHAST